MNEFGPTAGAAFAAAIPAMLSKDCALTELFLNTNALGEPAVRAFAEHLRRPANDSRGRSPREEEEGDSCSRGALSLLNLQDNGPSAAAAEEIMMGVECVENLML